MREKMPDIQNVIVNNQKTLWKYIISKIETGLCALKLLTCVIRNNLSYEKSL